MVWGGSVGAEIQKRQHGGQVECGKAGNVAVQVAGVVSGGHGNNGSGPTTTFIP